MADPREVQGSDADRAEGGLDVDDETAVRLKRENQGRLTAKSPATGTAAQSQPAPGPRQG